VTDGDRIWPSRSASSHPVLRHARPHPSRQPLTPLLLCLIRRAGKAVTAWAFRRPRPAPKGFTLGTPHAPYNFAVAKPLRHDRFGVQFTDMSCFYHHDRSSIGGCKSCGKALCPECAVDLGKGLACRGHCEDDVKALIALIDRNIMLSPHTARLLESGRRFRWGSALFSVITGVIFLAWGIRDMDRFSLIAVLGVCFLLYGAYGLFQARRIAKERQQT
jgi:hypothetical protein